MVETTETKKKFEAGVQAKGEAKPVETLAPSETASRNADHDDLPEVAYQIAELYKQDVPLREIEEQTGLARSTVQRWLKFLREQGLIEGKRSPGRRPLAALTELVERISKLEEKVQSLQQAVESVPDPAAALSSEVIEKLREELDEYRRTLRNLEIKIEGMDHDVGQLHRRFDALMTRRTEDLARELLVRLLDMAIRGDQGDRARTA